MTFQAMMEEQSAVARSRATARPSARVLAAGPLNSSTAGSVLESRRSGSDGQPAAPHRFGAVAILSLASPRVQTKLVLGQPGDRYEQEADAVAERVVGTTGPTWSAPRELPAQPVPSRTVQRQPAEETEEEPYREPPEPIGLSAALAGEEEDEKEQTVRAKPATGAAPTLTPEVERAIGAARADGQPLPHSVRQFMEAGFGASFSSVRVHDDAGAARLATSMHARAFTLGRDIFFGPGEYQPHSRPGQRLLAHELTHVVQQGGAPAWSTGSGSLPVQVQSPAVIQRTLAQAFTNYRGACNCGQNLGNNCAHYLSDALIRSGYAGDLDGGNGALYRRRNGFIVCRAGRPVRARELAGWFARQATSTHSGEPNNNAYWAVYQERHSDGQGHVCLHSHTGTSYTWRGTGDYPTWRTQDHYQF